MKSQKEKLVPPQPVRKAGVKAVTPADAATLIIWRKRNTGIEVLMGERHHTHRFMPQRYVFPGGKVDPHDARVRSSTELSKATTKQLERTSRKGRARSIGIAAIRETYEETGLMIGDFDPKPHCAAPLGWNNFFSTGLAPALNRLIYIARAVTPVFRPTRFDARFFLIGVEEVTGELNGSGELQNLNWFSVSDTENIELANVTRNVLRYAEKFVRQQPKDTAVREVPYFKHLRGGGHAKIMQ
tara:strand:- start:1631 stop:2356 length:726 start_codon:yes stop_codon:yes gene_type:complete